MGAGKAVFLIRPLWFLGVCITLWLVQLSLTLVVFHRLWPVGGKAVRWWELGAVSVSVLLGAVLVQQLFRALQWRPRRSPRPSAEIKAERQRIARDLHDHLGSKLICAMAFLEGGSLREREVFKVLDTCMLDLRLIVDSMDGADEPFVDRLARLRHRVQPALERRGICLVWDVDTPALATPFPPDGGAQLVAIIQEALSNVLQHSQATEVRVAVHYLAACEGWQVEISDNGQGMPASVGAERPAGRGIEGMRRRALTVGGQLGVLQTPDGGMCVRAMVPCRTAAGTPGGQC